MDTELYECKHCEGLGTCSTGKDGSSCLACVASHDLSTTRFLIIDRVYFGLRCGCCNGLLKSDHSTARMNKRMKPILAVLALFGLAGFSAISVYNDKSVISQLLTGWFSLVSAIFGFYFSQNKGE